MLEVRIEKNQCPSGRELLDDFETHPTFIPSAILEGVMSILNMGAFFGDTLYLNMPAFHYLYGQKLKNLQCSVCQNICKGKYKGI